jgi:hypothetical protein
MRYPNEVQAPTTVTDAMSFHTNVRGQLSC